MWGRRGFKFTLSGFLIFITPTLRKQQLPDSGATLPGSHKQTHPTLYREGALELCAVLLQQKDKEGPEGQLLIRPGMAERSLLL